MLPVSPVWPPSTHWIAFFIIHTCPAATMSPSAKTAPACNAWKSSIDSNNKNPSKLYRPLRIAVEMSVVWASPRTAQESSIWSLYVARCERGLFSPFRSLIAFYIRWLVRFFCSLRGRGNMLMNAWACHCILRGQSR